MLTINVNILTSYTKSRPMTSSLFYISLKTYNVLYILVEDIGVEPMTPCVQGKCSSQLS